MLADSYEKKLRPLTLETPRVRISANLYFSDGFSTQTKLSQCLIPVANTPLIEYTLEFLAHAGVEDVIIFVSSHAEKIEEYIRSAHTPSISPLTRIDSNLVVRNGTYHPPLSSLAK